MELPIKNIVQLLRDVEIFSEFSDELLEEFAKNMKEIFLPKGEILFQKGDKESAMYVIIDGSVQIHDQEYIFTTLNNKQFFGEYSLIDSSVRSATVTAMRDTKLLELEQTTFEKVTNRTPEIWKSVLKALIKRLRDYNIIEEKLTMRTIDIQRKKYEVEKAKDSIESQKKELEAINTTKDKFFTIIAHDLKNPFSSVIGVSDMLIHKYGSIDSDKQYEFIKQINKFSKNAFNLLENLLQWARSQTGSLKINFKRTNLYTLVAEVVELFSINADQKQISVIAEIDKNLFAYIDKDMITTVMRNLLSNAIKFSKNSSKIYITAHELPDMVQIEVRDIGVGMDPETSANLFRIDSRSTQVGTENEEGTGLGLILCKEFVSKNGGEIWVESEIDRGSKFIFSIPKAL